jgi:ceramide synthetase
MLHDFNDIFLELAKLFHYLRQQNGKINIKFKRFSELSGILILITWFVTRIYYYPIKALYGMLLSPNKSIILPLIFLSWIIFAMDLFWFAVSIFAFFDPQVFKKLNLNYYLLKQWIVVTYYRLFTGQMKELTDVSAYDNNKTD